MLLRRVMEHVRTQNWTAVFLDFVIVIVGVCIGIQIANWNNERLLDKESAVFVELLKDDIKLAIELTQSRYDFQVERFVDGKDFLTNYKQLGDEVDLTDSQLNGLRFITFLTIPNIKVGSLKLALSSDSSGLIRNTEVRNAVVNFQKHYGRIDSVYNRVLKRMNLTEPVLNQYRSFAIMSSPRDNIEFDDLPMKFDLIKLQQSEEFDYAFQNALWGHHLAMRSAKVTSEQLKVLLAEIEKSTGI